MTEAHSQGVLASLLRLDVPVAALDGRSRVVWASAGFRALEGRGFPPMREGAAYVAACRRAPSARSSGLLEVATAVEAVVSGKRDEGWAEYRCSSSGSGERCWSVQVARGEGDIAAVVVHHERPEGDGGELLSLQLLAESTSDAVTMWDERGRCLWASPAVERVLLCPRKELLGHRADRVVPRQFLPSLAKVNELPVGAPLAFTAVLRSSGGLRSVEVQVHRAATTPPVIVAVARTIDERLRFERRLRWKQAALEGAEALARLGVWVWGPGDRWEWTPGLYVVHGYDLRRPPTLRAYLAAVSPEDRARFRRLFRGAAEEELTYRFRRADGSVRTLRVTTRRIPGGERVAVVRDVTEELRLQEMAVRLHGERAELLRESFDARDRERRRIAQELHDEVGASLTALLLTAERLSRGGRDMRRAVGRLARQTRELLATVRAFTRTAHVTHLEGLSLPDALGRLVDGFRDATRARLSLRVSGDLPELAPPGLLRIAQECLTNALRHAGASRVEVSCVGRGDGVVLTVQDDGKGMRAGAGQGMGLSGIVSRAEAMGGSATLSARRGQGTRVEVRVPLLLRRWSST